MRNMCSEGFVSAWLEFDNSNVRLNTKSIYTPWALEPPWMASEATVPPALWRYVVGGSIHVADKPENQNTNQRTRRTTELFGW